MIAVALPASPNRGSVARSWGSQIVLVASPTKPQDPAYPRRAYDVLAWTLAFSLIFGICRLIVATIEDHLD